MTSKRRETRTIDIVINTIITISITFNDYYACYHCDYYYCAIIIIIAINIINITIMFTREGHYHHHHHHSLPIIYANRVFIFINTFIRMIASWRTRVKYLTEKQKEMRRKGEEKERKRRGQRKREREMMTMKYVPMYLRIIY